MKAEVTRYPIANYTTRLRYSKQQGTGMETDSQVNGTGEKA